MEKGWLGLEDRVVIVTGGASGIGKHVAQTLMAAGARVKAQGDCAEEFRDTNMFVIFGDNAPPEIKDYCYWIDLAPINGTIAAGQYLRVDGQSYKITAVGEEAPVTLAGLGHCTFNFNGLTEVDLPGTIYVEEKPLPVIKTGTVIQIVEE